MMMYNLGPLALQTIPIIPGTKFMHTASIAEVEKPWRYGHAVIIKYWRGRGLLLGWWTGRHPDEDSALILAIGGREDELLDEDGRLQERFEREPDYEVGWGEDGWQVVEVHDAKDVWK